MVALDNRLIRSPAAVRRETRSFSPRREPPHVRHGSPLAHEGRFARTSARPSTDLPVRSPAAGSLLTLRAVACFLLSACRRSAQVGGYWRRNRRFSAKKGTSIHRIPVPMAAKPPGLACLVRSLRLFSEFAQ